MTRLLLGILFIINISFISCTAQENEEQNENSSLIFYTNYSVQNEEADYAKEIIQLWEDYLLSREYARSNSDYWLQGETAYPDYPYISLLLDLIAFHNAGVQIQCNILGITPVENDHYMLKSMFSQVNDTTKQVSLKFITTVYAKKIDDEFKLVNSTQYHKGIWKNKQVGSINYIIHPEHDFNEADAIKMDKFNQEIAAQFEAEPIEFDYVVTNHTDQLSQLMGMDFFNYSYQAVRSGGMADNMNTVIYAGNNSAYYPHEVVHLYTFAKFRRQYHHWADEGVAAFFGGSTGYVLDWHLQKLKVFLAENPDFKMNDLIALQTQIPNGEYITDFRYAIGGFIAKKIHKKEGMQGLFDLLSVGREEENYFAVLKDKLGINKEDFGKYVRAEIAKIKSLPPEKMEKLKY